MRPADQITQFVHDALVAGRSRDDISQVLRDAGWTAGEISGALAAYAETEFSPPVPRPRPFVSAREAFLYGLMFVALAVSAWHLSSLIFNIIDRWLPEAGDRQGIYQLRAMRFSIASLVVFFPLFLAMNLRMVRATRADPGKRRSGVRKWFGYITLFLASLGLLGDLIFVIYSFLNGDLTLRVALKAATVAVIAGLILQYFQSEIGGEKDAL